MHDNEMRNRFLELRARGLSFNQIAQELNVAKQTLINWSKSMAKEISNLKACEIDALRQNLDLTRRAKLEAYGSQIIRLREELDKRDFSEVSTDKLLDMLTKCHQAVKDDLTIIFRTEDDSFDIGFIKEWQV